MLEPLAYIDSIRGFEATVPRGFFSDGASVPDWAWIRLGAGFVELLPFGLLHDYLVREGATIRVAGEDVPVPSCRWADTVMAEAMRTRSSTASDARLVRWALAISWGYWHAKPVDWRG